MITIYNKAFVFDNFHICLYMCRVDIMGTHIVSAWYSLKNQVRHQLFLFSVTKYGGIRLGWWRHGWLSS
jgi:hypothetical protein